VTVGQKKKQNVENKSSTNKFFKLFGRKTSNGENAEKQNVSDKIRSAPSSPSTLRRFFRRSSFQKSTQKMSKSRSETSLNAEREKSPKSAEEKSPKKVGLKRSKSLNDGQCDIPKVAVAAK
jgi:hypothetical protein